MYPLFSQRNSQGSFYSSSLKEYYKRWVTKDQLKVCALTLPTHSFWWNGITGCHWSNINSNISRFYKLIWYVYANLNHFFLLFRCQKLRESKDVKCTECGVRSNLAYCFECGWVQDFTIAVIHEFPETEQLSGTAICYSLNRRGYNNIVG